MRMFELVPVPVITDFLFVLFTKSLPFYAITFRKHTDAHRYSFSTAVGLFNTVVNIVLLVVVNTVCKRLSDVSFI